MKKLIPAIVMLLVSAVVLSTASYAWFTTTTDATASGMSVTAKAPSSLLIKKENDTEFSASVSLATDAPAELKPVSSANGINFFKADDCEDLSGGAKWNTKISDVTEGGKAVVTNGVLSGYYLEYQLDVFNAGTIAVDVVLKSVTVGTSNLSSAVRVGIAQGTTSKGVFCGDSHYASADYVRYPTAENVYSTEKADGPLNSTSCALSGDANFALGVTQTNAVEGTPATVLYTLQPQQTVRLTVRVWVEGQAEACIGANANLAATADLVFAAIDNAEATVTTPVETPSGEANP